MFECPRRRSYLECGDMSPLSKRGRVRALQNSRPDMKASMRCLIVAITICSWFTISNHCAFAAMATKDDSAQTACPFHSKPEKQKEQSSQVQCCKILRAVVPTIAKSWARSDGDVSDIYFPFEDCRLLAHFRDALAPLLVDTGPPDAHSFAELILQRSLFAHAPPFLF
jgi:hypothetical protein